MSAWRRSSKAADLTSGPSAPVKSVCSTSSQSSRRPRGAGARRGRHRRPGAGSAEGGVSIAHAVRHSGSETRCSSNLTPAARRSHVQRAVQHRDALAPRRHRRLDRLDGAFRARTRSAARCRAAPSRRSPASARTSCDAVGTSRRRSACAKAARIGAGAAPLETQSPRRSWPAPQQPRKRAEPRRAAEAAAAERHRARRLEAEVGAGAARVGVGLEGLELVARDVGEHQCAGTCRARRPAARGPAAPPVAAAPLPGAAARPAAARPTRRRERAPRRRSAEATVVLFACVLQRREVGGLGQWTESKSTENSRCVPVEQRAAHHAFGGGIGCSGYDANTCRRPFSAIFGGSAVHAVDARSRRWQPVRPRRRRRRGRPRPKVPPRWELARVRAAAAASSVVALTAVTAATRL